MNKICILTYDTAHRKTAEVFWGLHHRGGFTIDFLAMPFVERPQREVVFAHRPHQFEGATLREIAAFVDAKVIAYDKYKEVMDAYDWFIVCGSNLIEEDFARSGKILNCHSGLIPESRGLDAFKWAILNGRKIGNTLHVIDEEADKGEVKAHLETPLFKSDTLATFARRHYQNEIWMLQHFDVLLQNGHKGHYDEYDATRRMPIRVEEEMIAAFDKYKEQFACQ